MGKIKELEFNEENDHLFLRLIKDFFNPFEVWGRQNRKQLYVGLICTIIYFIANILLKVKNPDWNPFIHTSNGLLAAVFICAGHLFIAGIADTFNIHFSKYPWYEKYMPTIITLLGLTTLMGLQNLNSNGNLDAALWINISFLFIIFIIAAGYFVQGSNHEKVLKVWFALLGYYFSIIVFFYSLEKFVIR
jgi:hypothetical protein